MATEPTELQKAIEEADAISNNPTDYYKGELGLSVHEIEILRDAAKQLESVTKERDELSEKLKISSRDLLFQVSANAQLRADFEKAVEAINMVFIEPSIEDKYPNGDIQGYSFQNHSEACRILKKALSTPSAVEYFGGHGTDRANGTHGEAR